MNRELLHFEQFAKGKFGNGNEMIPEIPVGAGGVLDVGAHQDQEALGLQAPVGFPHGAFHMLLVGQVLNKIAGENDIEGI